MHKAFPVSVKSVPRIIVCVALASAGLTACGSSGSSGGDDTIKIGVVAAQSGAFQTSLGLPGVAADKVVIDEANKAGGVDGKKFELIVCDDRSDATQAAKCAQKLVSQDRVTMIQVASASTDALAVLPIAAAGKVPMVFDGGTAAVTAPGKNFPWVFRAGIQDAISAKGEFDKMVSDGHKKIAVFSEDDAYGEAGIALFKSSGQVACLATAPVTATNVTAQVLKLKKCAPDAVNVHVSATALGAAFARAAQSAGLKAQVYYSPGLGAESFAKLVGSTANGSLIPLYYNFQKPDARETAFFDKVKANGSGATIGLGTIIAGDGMYVIVDAIKRAGADASGDEIRKGLEEGNPIQVLSPQPIKYSAENHDGLADTKMFVWCTIENASFTC